MWKGPPVTLISPVALAIFVFNHTGVSVVDCGVVEYRHNLHGHILRVQLKASVGDFTEVGSLVNLGCPDHCGLGNHLGASHRKLSELAL